MWICHGNERPGSGGIEEEAEREKDWTRWGGAM
jgi:hypothetical protein